MCTFVKRKAGKQIRAAKKQKERREKRKDWKRKKYYLHEKLCRHNSENSLPWKHNQRDGHNYNIKPILSQFLTNNYTHT